MGWQKHTFQKLCPSFLRLKFHLRLPIGGWANGIPWKEAYKFPLCEGK